MFNFNHKILNDLHHRNMFGNIYEKYFPMDSIFLLNVLRTV